MKQRFIRWTDIDLKTPLPRLIQLINLRLGRGVAGELTLCEIVIGDGVSVITSDSDYGDVNFPDYPCEIQGWMLTALQPGTIAIDLWVANYLLHFPPVVGDSIVNGHYPSLTATDHNRQLTVNDWTSRKKIKAGDVMRVHTRPGVTGVKQVTLALIGTKG